MWFDGIIMQAQNSTTDKNKQKKNKKQPSVLQNVTLDKWTAGKKTGYL